MAYPQRRARQREQTLERPKDGTSKARPEKRKNWRKIQMRPPKTELNQDERARFFLFGPTVRVLYAA